MPRLALHVDRHSETRLRIFRRALGLGIAEKDHDGISDEFIERAAILGRDVRHLREVLVQEARDLLRLQTFRGAGEVLDVREKDRELLAFSLDSYLPLAAENARIDLRCEIARDVPRYVGQYIVGMSRR